MTERVAASEIEKIVGKRRHRRAHWGRAVSAEQRVYILHSQNCVEGYEDLRECPFSRALDRGIEIEVWEEREDRPVLLSIMQGRLVPALIG